MNFFTNEIIKDALIAIGDEMFEGMIRSSMSPIIYETADFAVGLVDRKGNLLAQGNGVAAFLASLDTAVQSLLLHYPGKNDILPGDTFITNTPYEGGGTHLSDVIIITPVFKDQTLIAFAANKAHWTEVGGKDAGSVSTNATEIYQEGLQFSFLKLYDQGKENQALLQLIRDNVRLPESTLGDLHASVASTRIGSERVLELVRKYGQSTVLHAMEALLDYGERMTLEELQKLPQGVFEAEDRIESDGLGNGPFKVKVKVTLQNGKMCVDYTGTAAQAEGPINCSYAGLVTGTRCVFKSITNHRISANGGCFRKLEIICPEKTVLSAQKPAPVSLYYEAILAAIDVFWKALAPSLSDRLPAGSQRSVNATFISGHHADSGAFYVMGEPLVGGWGASTGLDGDNAQFCPMNGETYNIPIELAEARYGFMIDQYGFHNQIGGGGEYRGGKGVILDYRIRAEHAFLTYATSRFESRPWGMLQGREGTHNYVEIHRETGEIERHHMVTRLKVNKGEVIRLYTASGGGVGAPQKRRRDAILADLKNEYITREEARTVYGFSEESP